jgi:hypothetical protein
MPAGRGIAPLADIPDGQCRDGPTLAARIFELAAFRRLDEVNRGISPLANPG